MLRTIWKLSSSSSAVTPKPSPLVRTDGYRQHTFRWGVGNAFRSVTANRLSPVHLPRPKEVTLRTDYFESPHEAVQFDTLNEQWEVFWYEHNKMNAKPFPVKKFGVEPAKEAAVAFLEELERDGRFGERPVMESRNGAFWDERMQTWFTERGTAFSGVKHGVVKAKTLAESDKATTDLVQKRKQLADLIQSMGHS